MTSALRWRAGEAAPQRALEEVFGAPEPASAGLEVLDERSGRRRLARVRRAGRETLFVKHFFCTDHRHGVRERIKNAIGLSAARREWRALTRLIAAGVAVPAPRALAVLDRGDRLIATAHLEGRTLREALGGTRGERTPLLVAVGELVRRLHRAGFVHRDLHAGNVFVTANGPFLLDLQAARASRSRSARLRDLGALDDSLAALLSTPDRVRLRAAALGLRRPFDARGRRQLRAVGRASLARGRAHAASRTRRALRPGRRFAPLRCGAERGMQLRQVDRSAVLATLRAHRCGGSSEQRIVLKWDGRSRVSADAATPGGMVVKEYAAGGLLRRLADAFRGSPARRAWLGGHGLHARGIGAATPYAFVERRRFGVPVASAVVLEDLREATPADRCGREVAHPAQVQDALVRLVTRIHRRGVIHRDLKASHVYLGWRGNRLEARLLDLEDVRFRRCLRDRERIRALAQLNASLPDHIPDELRRRAFARYAAALPFAGGRGAALREIVALSLKRAHRWSGRACSAGRGPSGTSWKSPVRGRLRRVRSGGRRRSRNRK